DYLYGVSLNGFLPSLLNPLEILDGALVSGETHWAAMRNPTYCFQNSRLVGRPLELDGRELTFAGVIGYRGYNQLAVDKERSALLAAKLARELGVDGAIVTTTGGGNSHTDTMLTCRACERAGIRTVVVCAEQANPQVPGSGLTDWVPEADAIVS